MLYFLQNWQEKKKEKKAMKKAIRKALRKGLEGQLNFTLEIFSFYIRKFKYVRFTEYFDVLIKNFYLNVMRVTRITNLTCEKFRMLTKPIN